MSAFNDWLNGLNLDTANARHIDDDADGSFDCVDVAEDWCKFLWPNVPVTDVLGYGDAKDHYANASDAYFDKLPANIVSLPGDIPVWNGTATNSFGHIAVTVNDDGTNLTDVEQNTYTQEAATIAHRTHNNLIGFLRPKGIGEQTMNHNAGTEAYVTVFHRDAENPQVADQWNGLSPEWALKSMRDTDEWKAIDAKVRDYDNIKAQLTELQNKPAEPAVAPVEAPAPEAPVATEAPATPAVSPTSFLAKLIKFLIG